MSDIAIDDATKKQINDAEARTRLLAAQKNAVEAQLALEKSRKALADALAPSDARALAQKALEAQTNLATARKTLAEAESGKWAAIIGDVPSSGQTGAVETQDKAGVLEMNLLTALAITEAAARIATRVRGELEDQDARLHLYVSGQFPDYQAVYALTVQWDQTITRLRQTIDNATDLCKTNLAESAAGAALQATPLGGGAAGVAVSSLVALASYFKSDFKIGGADIAYDDTLLLQAVLGQDLGVAHLHAPGLFAAPDSAGFQTIINEQLDNCSALLRHADQLCDTLSAELAQAVASGNNSATQAALDHLKAAVTAQQELAGRLGASDEAGASLRRALASAASLMEENSYVLVLKLQRSAGSYFVKKNFWSAFGAMPFFAAGGAVVGYTLFNSRTGDLVASGVVAEHGGFMKVSEVPMACERGARKHESQAKRRGKRDPKETHRD